MQTVVTSCGYWGVPVQGQELDGSCGFLPAHDIL